ncbi:MAG: glycerophosphodiester phosphodiesterase family protein [Pseudomonadota bacterium]
MRHHRDTGGCLTDEEDGKARSTPLRNLQPADLEGYVMTAIATPAAAPRVVAHRGASAAAPENTVAAIRHAAAMGTRWVEVDVSLLGDGTAVLHHDATLGRTSDASGLLADIGAADLAGIDAGGWHSTPFAGEPIPTLEAALTVITALGIGVNLELKPHDADPAPLARATVAALLARPELAGRVVLSSFDQGALSVLADSAPSWPRAPIWHHAPRDWRVSVLGLGASAIHANSRHLDDSVLEGGRLLGLPVRCFTVNTVEEATMLRQRGVAAFFTDLPDLFLCDPDWAAWDRPSPAAASAVR